MDIESAKRSPAQFFEKITTFVFRYSEIYTIFAHINQLHTHMAEEKVKQTKIDELIPDDKNFNKGTEYGNSLIEKSLRKFGAGRSVLIDKNNRIIAGNKTIENASAIGLDDVIVVETDGKKIVAVKRTDIDLDSKEGRELALADNQTSAVNFSVDEEVLESVAEELDINLDDWGIDFSSESKQPNDISDDFQFDYKVEIQCNGEKQQEQIYNEMTERGFVCRILTL